MRLSVITTRIVLLGFAGIVCMGSAAIGEEMKFAASLDGAQQSPPLTVPGKGSADLTFDTETKKLDWTVEYSDLSGPPAAGHFHGPAGKGENAGVAIPFEGDLSSPIKGSATLTDEQAANLMEGKYYINLHTAEHKGGEIRGQVEMAM